MQPNEKTLLEGVLKQTLNVSKEEFDSLFNESGEELISTKLITDKDAERVVKFKKESSDQHSRGVRETMEKFERQAKEKYGIESDLKGIELIDSILESETSKVREKSKVKDDDWEKHPKFVEFKKLHEKEKKEIEDSWQQKLTEKEKAIERQGILSKVHEHALVGLKKKNPILPTDPEKAKNWENLYLNEIGNGNYQINDNDIVVLDNEGKPATDAHGNLIKFETVIDTVSNKYFDFNVAEKRQSPGNITQPPTIPIVIKTKAEFNEASKNAKTPQERAKILEAYEKGQAV